ncbi:hypothetical protein MHBO_003154 [Bonamia ostreae]|uniref:Uncharacterized protein n=1 Tax=Bonamia ostreae TaxID=126728 RepID=A0ABV2APM0_9EUKA
MAIIKNCRVNFLRFFEILPRALLRATCFGFIVLTYFTSAIVLNFIQFLILRFFLIGKTKRRAIVRKICQFWWNLTDFSAFYFLGLKFKFSYSKIDYFQV